MFSDPTSILDQMHIPQGAVVVDIGAGSGAYTMILSLLTGDRGKVYALDIQKDVLTRLATEARAKHRYNVEVLWGDAEKPGGTKLRDGACDIAIVANILFQVEKKDIFIQEVRRILKPQGQLLLVDWKGSFNNMGPHADNILTRETAKQLFENAGFLFLNDIEAGMQHYGMIFKKS